MVFGDNSYSVLVVSAVEKFNDVMATLLPSADYYPVKFATNIAAAKRAYLEQPFDFVIINAPLPDDFGARFASQVCAGNTTVAMVLVKADVYEENHAKLSNDGIFTLPKPTSTQMMGQALKWMAAARERLRRLEVKAVSIEVKMEEIRLVNRAKWLLIENQKMSEQEAHRYIEKQAMNHCVSRKEIALNIIDVYARPNDMSV